MTKKIEPTVTVAAELTERCDQCGAAGKLHATFLTGGELTFCGHHANRFAARLMESAAMIMVELGFGWRGATLQPRQRLERIVPRNHGLRGADDGERRREMR